MSGTLVDSMKPFLTIVLVIFVLLLCLKIWVSFCFIIFFFNEAVKEKFSMTLYESFVYILMTGWCEV